MLNSSIWRAVLSLFYPPVIIQGKNGKNSESPVGSNKSEKRKPKSAVYRSILASVVYFHIRLISTRRHKREMTRNQVVLTGSWVRIPPAPPTTIPRKSRVYAGFLMSFCGALISHCWLKWCPWCPDLWYPVSCALYILFIKIVGIAGFVVSFFAI